MNTFVKILLSIIVSISAVYPYYDKSSASGTIDMFTEFGILKTLLIIVLFFIAVALYCSQLQRVLELIHPSNRACTPRSVWLMFLIPYNFIEDFFIIINIANSLKAEAQKNRRLKNNLDFGMTTGVGWAIAQIMSFLPGIAGQIAGAVALFLWITHWIYIYKVRQVLTFKGDSDKMIY